MSRHDPVQHAAQGDVRLAAMPCYWFNHRAFNDEISARQYRGAPAALSDLIGGQVHVMFDSMPSSIGHIRAGRLRPLAVTTATRWEGLRDVPTVGDFVPGYECSVWSGLGAPRNTPAEFVQKLNEAINAGLADPKLQARLADQGSTPFLSSPANFGKFIAEEVEKWGNVVRFSGAKPS